MGADSASRDAGAVSIVGSAADGFWLLLSAALLQPAARLAIAAAAHASFAYPRYPKTDPPIRSVRLQLSSGLIEFAIKHWSRGQIAGGH